MGFSASSLSKTSAMTTCRNFITVLLISALFFSCSNSSMRIMATWVNKEKVAERKPGEHKVFIFVLTQNYEAQIHLENDLAAAAAAKGINVVKSIDAFGPILTRDKLPEKEAVINSIQKLGCDGVFMVALVDEKSETHYNPGTTGGVYTPYPGYGYGYAGYYAYTVPLYDPGYYTTEKTYFIESNFFDVNTGQMLMSMQSKVVNPPAIEKASKKYTNMLMTELQARGLVKK